MKYFKLGLLVVLNFIFTQCDIGVVNTNEIALELSKLQIKGVIEQSERKDSLMFFFEETIIKNFVSEGFGHRINEIKEDWNVYEDKDFVIFTGSIAKNDNDIYVFTIVYKNHDEGKFNLVYKQIGDIKTGKYPENIIPY